MLSMLSGTHNSCHKGGPGRFFGVKVNPSCRRLALRTYPVSCLPSP